MPPTITRDNHYVPIWYQRGFLAKGQSQFLFCDMSPSRLTLADGRVVGKRAISTLTPKACFFARDLYTTEIGGQINDEIERLLFGKIDNVGAIAIRALARGDLVKVHDHFQDLFTYLDAQKLRTPKGLAWIKSRYADLPQQELMREMQSLRQLHCTMWMEGVREIVSAEKSDVKFLLTDNPITLYNPVYPPDSPECAYPNDPAIEKLGTQTIYPLDADRCLIITNLEYAEHPEKVDCSALRTNARYVGKTLARTDSFIRTRFLNSDEVTAINHVLKRRAHRYIAAAQREWLTPEGRFVGSWGDIAKVFLPRDELWRFGGEIYIGYKDGSTDYQDAYGRTSKSHEYLKKKRGGADPKPGDLCGCGSARVFARCCEDLPQSERPSWDVYSIRERNLIFCGMAKKILGLDAGKTWVDVRRNLSGEQVKDIHEAYSALWPVDTDFLSLLPRPKKDIFRTLFLGATDPRTLRETVIGWLSYFDEIVVASPFLNPALIAPKFSPVKSPDQHKSQTVKNVLTLLTLEPFIAAGIIHLVPDLGDFNFEFHRSVMHMATERMNGWKHSDGDLKRSMALAKDDFERTVKRMPEAAMRRKIAKAEPNASEEFVNEVLEYTKRQLEDDPCALLQPLPTGHDGGEAQITKGFGLESAMFTAQLMGAVLYTDELAFWKQIQAHACGQQHMVPHESWGQITEGVKKEPLPIYLDERAVYRGRADEQYAEFTAALTAFRNGIETGGGVEEAAQLAGQLLIAMPLCWIQWRDAAKATSIESGLEIIVPNVGFTRQEVTRLLLTYARGKTAKPIPMALLLRLSGKLLSDVPV